MSENIVDINQAIESVGHTMQLDIAKIETLGNILKTIDSPNRDQIMQAIACLKDMAKSARDFADVLDRTAAYAETEILKDL